VTASIAALHAGRVVVPRVAEWESPPGVWLHPDLGDLYGPLVRAVAEWEALGHDLGAMMLGGTTAGMGILVLPRPLDRVRAVALAELSADFEEEPHDGTVEDDHDAPAVDGVILRATIYVDPLELVGRDAARVLAHELGHCLGFMHCTARLGRKHAATRDVVLQVPKHGHLMHPSYDEGGWSTTGLQADALGSAHERRMERRRERERRRVAR
jgi:hypothetical protein